MSDLYDMVVNAEEPKPVTAGELESYLFGFSGTVDYHLHWTRRFHYTDGVKGMAEKARAFWLIDLIASHQGRSVKAPLFFGDKEGHRLHDVGFQIWVLDVRADKTATARCIEDSGQPDMITQEIEYTDFPEGSWKFYLVQDVLMLPGEY